MSDIESVAREAAMSDMEQSSEVNSIEYVWGAEFIAGRIPGREEIAHTLDLEGAQIGDCGHDPGEANECANGCSELLLTYADAVLLLIEKQIGGGS